MRSLLLVAVMLLSGCPIVDTGETPVAPPICRPDPNRFREPGGIWDTAIAVADMEKSCIVKDGCHSQATGRSALRLIDKPRDMLTDSDWTQNYEVVARFLNCSTPSASPFVTKPESGADPHLGGDLWECTGDCEPIRTIEEWISGG
jgi:hypothetical protein